MESPISSTTTAEAGWYYVEGDPPGTVRRWNGFEWIGFAIPDPSGAAGGTSMHGARASTRKRFTGLGRLLSILTVLALALLACLFATLAWQMWQGSQTMPSTGRPRSANGEALATSIPSFWDLSSAIFLIVMISALLFIPWLRGAAATAEIHKIRGHGAKKRVTTPLVLKIILFFMFPLPMLLWWLVKASVRGIQRGDNRRAGMLGVVSDTATAASTDPRTGVVGISPVKIMVWWAFWWLPAIVGIASWSTLWVLWPTTDSNLQTIVELNAIMVGLEAISVLAIIITVVQISARLWR